jgi:hypothetical protein
MAIVYFGLCTSDGTLSGDDTNDNSGGANVSWNVNKTYACSGTGSQLIEELGVYCKQNGGVVNVAMALYTTGNVKIAWTKTEKAVSVSLGWITWNRSELNFATDGIITGGTNYRIAHSCDDSMAWRVKTGSAGDVQYSNTDYTSGSWPSTLSAGTSNNLHPSHRVGVQNVLSAAITGTATASITEADVVTGGKTVILTLTGDTWVAA